MKQKQNGKRCRENKNMKEKAKKRRWDTIIVGIGMTIAFVIVLMKLTGYWPCEIILSLQIEQISCDKSIQENMSSIANWFQNSLS